MILHARTRLGLIAALCAAAVICFVSALVNGPSARAAAGNPTGEHIVYASPVEMLLSKDSTQLYVLCQGTDEVRVLDPATFSQIKAIPVGHIPRGFSLSPDGARLYVANTWDDTISVIDTKNLAVDATWPISSEPTNVVEDRAAKYLFALSIHWRLRGLLDFVRGLRSQMEMCFARKSISIHIAVGTSIKSSMSGFPLTLAMNCINRSMGQPDLYPFVLSPSVIEKLGYIGNLIHVA